MDITRIVENFKKASDSLGMFIHDLVWLWRRSDRFRVLLVGASFLCFVCASQQRWLQQIIPFFQNFPQLVNQTGLSILWILAGVLWLWTIYEAARTKKDALTQAEKFTERKAIKGLRPFTEADREIFQHLERDRPLQECLAKINGEDFRFGILFGESGCGKTSFLQAGLMPQLCEPESKIQGIYVSFSDRDPLLTIHQALVEQLPLMPEAFNQAVNLWLVSHRSSRFRLNLWGLVPIGETYAKLGNWSQVRHIALDKCPHISCKVELLTNV